MQGIVLICEILFFSVVHMDTITGKRGEAMLWIIVIVIVCIDIWFRIPYSPLCHAFEKNIGKEEQVCERTIQESDLIGIPDIIVRYLKHCGYLKQPLYDCVKMTYRNVHFAQSGKGPYLKMDCIQYNRACKPMRRAYMKSSMVGIPFEGYDSFTMTDAGMKGVLGKVFTLFDTHGSEMIQSGLVTWLAECLFVPQILFEHDITYEVLDEHTVRIAIQGVSGIFSFNDNDEMICFTTEDRYCSNNDGTYQTIPWSAQCSDYRRNDNGILAPTQMKAIWHMKDGDFTYFDGTIENMEWMA